MYLSSGKNDGKNNNRPDLLSDHDIGKFPDAERLQPDILCGDKCACRTGTSRFLKEPLHQIRFNLSAKMWMIVDSIITVSAVACFTTLYFITDHPEIVYPLCVAAVFSSLGCVYLVAYISKSTQDMYNMQRLDNAAKILRRQIKR